MFLIRNNLGIALQKTQGAISLTRHSTESGKVYGKSQVLQCEQSPNLYGRELFRRHTHKWGKVGFERSFKER
jgi:hypothetical protein